jgi:predicted secreted protein
MMKPLLRCLEQEDIGIIQLPCPELMALGLDRNLGAPAPGTIRQKIELPESRARLEPLIDQVVHQMKEYIRHGFQVVGTIGKQGSPTCGVRATGCLKFLDQAEGIFIKLLRQRLTSEGVQVEMVGVEDHRQQEVVDWVLKRG